MPESAICHSSRVPANDPWYITLLDRLGVNTTKLRWRLYQREKQAKQILETGVKPPAPSWWSYPNKICSHCRAINNRESTVCDSCGRRLPTMWGYRIRRLILGAIPAEGPAVTMAFLGMMLVFWGVQMLMDGIGARGALSPSGNAMQALGAFTPAYAVREGEYWRCLAFGLVHGGLFHIGMNSYFLVQIGPMVERQLTRARMLVLVTMSQIASAIACYVWYGQVKGIWFGALVVGASGWLFGLLGFGIIYAHRSGILSMRNSLIQSAAFMFILGFVVNSYAGGGGISNTAHFGGLAGGLLFGILPESRRSVVFSERAWNVAGIISLALWIVTLAFVVRSVVIEWPQINEAR